MNRWIAFLALFLSLQINGFSQVDRNEVDTAVDKGIAFLISQQKENGSILDRGHPSAMSALSIMAMASVGHQTVDESPEGKSMRRALSFMLEKERQDPNGYFGTNDGSRMYGHGIVSLMLTEMLGMGVDETMDDQIHERCQKGIDLIVRSQKTKKPMIAKGGWRYTPDAGDSDLSVSVWQLMALRSAKNDGLEVPSQTIDDAMKYLMRSFTSPVDRDNRPLQKKSGFSYEPQNRNPTFTMTSAGLLALQVCGDYDSDLVEGATEWLLENPPKQNDRFLMYGLYYYAQGMHQRGGEVAKTADTQVRNILLPSQKGDGSWVSPSGEEQGIGSVYATSLAILSLSVKYHYLPIYQR
jgi:hypothetical protein